MPRLAGGLDFTSHSSRSSDTVLCKDAPSIVVDEFDEQGYNLNQTFAFYSQINSTIDQIAA